MRRTLTVLGALALLAVVLPAAALAQGADPVANGDTFDIQLWAFAAALIVPLGTYAINYIAPYTGEKVKGVMHLVIAAGAGAIIELIEQGGVGFDQETLEYVISAIIGALSIHFGFYRPSTINTWAGGGRNVQEERAAR